MPAAQPEFAIVITPHRSLGRSGFLIVLGALAAASFATGLVFTVMGAWPVTGFLGLDVALVWWAFRRNFADAKRSETVEISDGELIVRRFLPGQPVEERHFVRGWVRVELERDEARDLIGPLKLFSRGQGYEIGSWLSPEERVDLAAALKTALARPRM